MRDIVGRPDGRLIAAAAAAFGAGFVVTATPGAGLVVLAVGAVVSLWPGGRWAGAAIAAVTLSATLASGTMPEPPVGPIQVEAVTLGDPFPVERGELAVVKAGEYRLLASADAGMLPPRGTVLVVDGTVTVGDGSLRGTAYRGRLRVREVTVVGPRTPFDAMGNAVRSRVMERTASGPGGALLAGFMVGDTSRLDRVDVQAMRLSGLTHFVAVSGRNVTLVLALWALLLGPLAWGPRRRIVLGLFALVVFAFATRFTPSVVRASAMAAFVLVGRLVGVHLTAWQALGAAVIAVSIAQPDLTHAVGFQLSAAATAGVLVGARVEVDGGVARAVAITVGAQVFVAPILLVTFGHVPLMAPLTNLVAAPLVAVATIAGVVGVIGVGPALWAGETLAGVVLAIARWGAEWPQVGWVATLTLTVAGALAMSPRRRHWGTGVAAVVAVTVLLAPPIRVDEPAIVFLDVGQGDAVLILAGGGRAALYDGGPDPVLLRSALRRYGVERLDLVVLSHSHHDHVAGLVGLFPGVSVGEVWERTEGSAGAEPVLERAAAHGVPVRSIETGTVARLGDVTIEVMGPVRRYRSTNDQSIVLRVVAPGRTALLTGDIEAVAQQEIGVVGVDVLQVPHHGAGTTDQGWLQAMAPSIAVASLGEGNRFGHPATWVIGVLEGSGSTVYRTDRDGDVVVPLGSPSAPVSAAAARHLAVPRSSLVAAAPSGSVWCVVG